jgi:hypothetical protein
MVLITQLIGALLCTAVSALPQGPNTLAQNNPNVRTQAVNGSRYHHIFCNYNADLLKLGLSFL